MASPSPIQVYLPQIARWKSEGIIGNALLEKVRTLPGLENTKNLQSINIALNRKKDFLYDVEKIEQIKPEQVRSPILTSPDDGYLENPRYHVEKGMGAFANDILQMRQIAMEINRTIADLEDGGLEKAESERLTAHYKRLLVKFNTAKEVSIIQRSFVTAYVELARELVDAQQDLHKEDRHEIVIRRVPPKDRSAIETDTN